jgi:hypothetical protein
MTGVFSPIKPQPGSIKSLAAGNPQQKAGHEHHIAS